MVRGNYVRNLGGEPPLCISSVSLCTQHHNRAWATAKNGWKIHFVSANYYVYKDLMKRYLLHCTSCRTTTAARDLVRDKDTQAHHHMPLLCVIQWELSICDIERFGRANNFLHIIFTQWVQRHYASFRSNVKLDRYVIMSLHNSFAPVAGNLWVSFGADGYKRYFFQYQDR